MINVELIRHHIPDLHKRSRFIYVARQCPFCVQYKHGQLKFRINTKLKVFKCYNCGRGGKDTNKFIHYLKCRDLTRNRTYYFFHDKMRLKRMRRSPYLGVCIDVHYGPDKDLPF